MNKLQNIFERIKETKINYDIERDKDRFNVFTALHKERDEVNLHSRTISYLLSPTSGHGMGTTFTKIFLHEILKISEQEFSLDGVEVIPNEINKTEYKEIDILLINKRKKQAIIIENKIDAKDSNHEEPNVIPGYSGQLERYYNTIKTGRDKDGNNIADFKCDSVLIYYLTLYKYPTPASIGNSKDVNVKILFYKNELREWLIKCVEKTPNTSKVKSFIQQYLNLINKMTNNDISIKEREEIRKNISPNWKELKYLIDNFKHIKWHTVYDFWNTLKDKLEKQFTNVAFYPESDEFEKVITNITHNNKNINHGIIFNDNDRKRIYISGMNALSWGIVEQNKWSAFKDNELENIIFSNFSTENTYRLIEQKNINKAIDRIISEIIEAQKNGYKSLIDK